MKRFEPQVNPALPVSVGEQLRSQIEYGLAAGLIPEGTRLPPIRHLARRLGISPVTVSQVYARLRDLGLLRTRPGTGTYAVRPSRPGGRPGPVGDLSDRLERAVDGALEDGFTLDDVRCVATYLLDACTPRPGARARVALVGRFPDATAGYARELSVALADLSAHIEPFTIDDLASPATRKTIAACEIVVTFPYFVVAVETALGRSVNSLILDLAPQTRQRLAEVPADARLGVVSTLADFLPTMLSAMAELCAAPVRASALSDDQAAVDRILTECDTVVYATGSEVVAALAPPSIRLVHYRFTPEPASTRTLRPLIAGAHRSLAGRGAPVETR